MIAAECVRESGAPARRIVPTDEHWPAGIRDLADAPARLYWRGGRLPSVGEAVAVVGSRAASAYGLAFAERLARDLAGAGCTVVSGLARGVDTSAHRGALAGDGATVAVLPSALDRVTPAENAGLAARIAGQGALLSEVERGGPFGPGAFIRRNRLIAALAAVTVVVEAGAGSGALATARIARRLGRVVLAVPGDVDRPGSHGPLALLRTGAGVCAGAGDVLAAIERLGHALPRHGAGARVAAALDAEARTVEDLAALTGLTPAEAAAALLELEWAGRATACAGGRWARPG